MHCTGNKWVHWALASEGMVINNSNQRQGQHAASERQKELQIKGMSPTMAFLAAEGLPGFLHLFA